MICWRGGHTPTVNAATRNSSHVHIKCAPLLLMNSEERKCDMVNPK